MPTVYGKVFICALELVQGSEKEDKRKRTMRTGKVWEHRQDTVPSFVVIQQRTERNTVESEAGTAKPDARKIGGIPELAPPGTVSLAVPSLKPHKAAVC